MKRGYTRVQAVESEILEMKEAGKTNKEIAEHFGFKDKYVIKYWTRRYNQRKRKLEAGITPRRPGRPSKGQRTSEAEKDYEIKRLQMENRLLRDFLKLAGGR